MDNQIDGYTAAEKQQDKGPHWTFVEDEAPASKAQAEAFALIRQLRQQEIDAAVEYVMTNETLVIEIISNNEDCQSSIMDMMSIQVAATMTSKLTMDQAQQLARASMDLIGLVEKHAEGYVK